MSVEAHQAAVRPDRSSPTDAASGNGGARRLGRRRQPRREAAHEHGMSHLLEHMAFKGTTPRTARADRRGHRGGRGRSQCCDQRRDHGLFRARAEGRRAAGARRAVRYSRQSGVRGRGGGARAERHRPGNRRGAGHARRPDVRAFAANWPFPDQPMGRSLLGTPRRCRRSPRHAARISLDRITARPTWWWRRRAPSITSGRGRGLAALRQLLRPVGAEAAGRRSSAAARVSCAAISNRRI